MGFSIFCILESLLLLANAIAILSDKFLKRCKKNLNKFLDNIHKPFSESKNYISAKNQIALLLYVIRRYGKCMIN